MSLKSLKHYRMGDIIMTAKPVVYVVVDQMKGQLCDYCLTVKSTLMSCNDCRQMFYCNQICQQNDWAYHRLECHTFANSPHMKSSTKLMMRLWFVVNNIKSIGLKVYPLPNGQYLSLNEMKVNGDLEEDIKRVVEETMDESDLGLDDLSQSLSTKEVAVIQFRALVQTFIECQLDPDLTQLWKLFVRLWSNVLQIEVIESDYSDNAYGLYVQMSSLGHSCEPNCCYVSYGTQLQVRAIKPIAPNEKITISYIDFANPKPIRIQLLKSYFICCDCLKCRLNSDSNLDYDLFHQLKSDFTKLFASVKNDINGDKQELLAIADKLVPFYDSIYVDYYPDLSLFLLKYLKIMFLNVIQTNCSVINRDYVKYVIQDIRITHGIDHKLYRKVPVVRNTTLSDLESDMDRVLKTLQSKPSSTFRTFFLRAFILMFFLFIIYNNFDLFSTLI